MGNVIDSLIAMVDNSKSFNDTVSPCRVLKHRRDKQTTTMEQ